MAVNKPVGDNARKGAVKKRSQLKTKLGGATAWTKRSKSSGEFMAVKKPKAKKKAAEEIQGRSTREVMGKVLYSWPLPSQCIGLSAFVIHL
jgi:hypothetical protein